MDKKAVLDLILEAKASGLTFRIEGSELKLSGPSTAGTIVEKLRPHKAAILEIYSNLKAERSPQAIAPAAAFPPVRVVYFTGETIEIPQDVAPMDWKRKF